MQTTQPRVITLLGSTGSIGTNTLSVIAKHPDQFRLYALTAFANVESIYEQCKYFKPSYAAVVDVDAASKLESKIKAQGLNIGVLQGMAALEKLACASQVDCVMAAIVGISGLKPTFSAVKAGKTVLLANKEALVTAGQLFMDQARMSNATIIPVDSEHNAIFQALPEKNPVYQRGLIDKIILTASGGPFLNQSINELKDITPEKACAHPNWRMGRKISVDSSTMMNKALEVIEAYWLFDVPVSDLSVLIHPQSIVHSMVKYVDGSLIAQIGSADMRIPIAYALFYPERGFSNAKELDLTQHNLSFQTLDYERFELMKVVYDLLETHDYAGTIVLNAANELLVESFLARKINYLDIIQGIKQALNQFNFDNPATLDDVIAIDAYVRKHIESLL